MLKTWADFGIDLHGVSSGETDTQCPQCSAQRKKKSARCLSVNVGKGTFFCHHCGWAGGLGTGERRLDVAWNRPKYRMPEPTLTAPDSVMAYLEERGITRAVAKRNRVSAATVYMPQVEGHVKAIAFTYYRGDQLVNVKYRDREKNFRMEAGAERIL